MKELQGNGSLVEVLTLEDSPGDVRLTREASLVDHLSVRLHVAQDGVEAVTVLRREGIHSHAPRPDLILLDLNLLRMDGREVLALVKRDEGLKTIPTVVLTTSAADAVIVKSYQPQANAYLSKPVQLDEFESGGRVRYLATGESNLVKSISDLTKVKLPMQRIVT